MKKAVLNTTQLSFLEELMIRFGKVVTYEQMARFAPGNEDVLKRQFVSRLASLGWLVRIKKGIYQIAEVGSLGTLTLSRYAVAQVLAPDSYVSFESALQFHGMYDQLLQTTTSITLRQRPSVTIENFRYCFVKTTEKYHFGFQEQIIDEQKALIAWPEKALIDMLQLHRSAHSADRVAEALAEHQHSLHLDRLHNYLLCSNLTTQRIFGLLLDTLNLPYGQDLIRSVQQRQSSSRLTRESDAYNAKWRLYYSPTLTERYNIT